MKTKYLFFGFTVLLVTGCVNEEFKTTPSANSVRVFADMPSTRVSFTEGDAVTYATWQDGDVISLSTDIQSNLQYVAGVVEEGNAGMEFLPGGEALLNNYGKVVYACYPSAAIDMENMTVPLPNTENYNQPDFRPFVYAIDTILSERLYLHFHHPYAYLKLTFTEGILPPDTISIGAVTITSDEVIAAASGKFNFSTQAVEVTGGSKTILIERLGGDGSGHVLKGSPYTLYVPVLPQSEGTKITIKACYTLGSGIENCYPYYTMEKIVPAGGFQAGHVYTLTMDKRDEPIARKPGIYTLEDLIAWRDERNAHGEYADLSKWKDNDGVVNIFADIDMSNVGNWDWVSSDEIIEGNGHVISNLNVEVGNSFGFFGNNSGVIRNLTITGNIKAGQDSTPGVSRGHGVFCATNSEQIYNCHSYVNIDITRLKVGIGGIASSCSGIIENCSNHGNIKAASVSGIADPHSGGKIINCQNYGTLENSQDGGPYSNSVGGIAASSSNSTITGCTNEGKVTGTYFVGGICGSSHENSTFSNCLNKGEVVCQGTSGAGGIVGTIGVQGVPSDNVQVAGCRNEGLVSSEVNAGGICGYASGKNVVFADNTYGGTVNGVAGTEANAIGLDSRE